MFVKAKFFIGSTFHAFCCRESKDITSDVATIWPAALDTKALKPLSLFVI